MSFPCPTRGCHTLPSTRRFAFRTLHRTLPANSPVHQAAVVTAHPTWLLLRCHANKNVRPTSIKQVHNVCPLMRNMGFGMVRLGDKHPQAHTLFQLWYLSVINVKQIPSSLSEPHQRVQMAHTSKNDRSTPCKVTKVHQIGLDVQRFACVAEVNFSKQMTRR